jgi:hypothetical protein
MQRLTSQGQKVVRELAGRFGVSVDAVVALLEAIAKGRGIAAQFSHPELGGAGQWMRGGMTQVADLFDHSLRAKVDGLCSALSAHLAEEPLLSDADGERGAGWWPGELGIPASAGTQNDLRYAYFPEKRRLAVHTRGCVTVYDTLHHRMTGFSHQQGAADVGLLFTSQEGRVDLDDLPVISHTRRGAGDDGARTTDSSPIAGRGPSDAPQEAESAEILATIERLHALKQSGALTEEEFAAKKAELLRRL